MCSTHITLTPETLDMGIILQSSFASSSAEDSLSVILLQLFGSSTYFLCKGQRKKKMSGDWILFGSGSKL